MNTFLETDFRDKNGKSKAENVARSKSLQASLRGSCHQYPAKNLSISGGRRQKTPKRDKGVIIVWLNVHVKTLWNPNAHFLRERVAWDWRRLLLSPNKGQSKRTSAPLAGVQTETRNNPGYP